MRRLIIAVAALILAVVGITSVMSYVRGADARALAGMKAVSVLVARKTIPAGTSAGLALRQGLLASEKLPASATPADAISAIGAGQAALVLDAALQPGQLLLRAALVAAVQVTNGLAIPPGMMAVTARFCMPEALAGTLQANSVVAVFDTVVSGGGNAQVSAQPACDGPHQQAGPGVTTRVVLSRVLVLSVGGSSASGSGGSSSGQAASASGQAEMLVTMAVSQANAEKLIQLAETGLPYLALLTTSSRIKADVGGLLQLQPSPSPSPTPVPATPAATASQGPASVIITQPSGSPIPVIIITPTSTPSPS